MPKPPGRQRQTGSSVAFSARLRAARESKGLTQAALAEILQVHAVTVARWETGTRTPRGLVRRYLELWIAGEAPEREEP